MANLLQALEQSAQNSTETVENMTKSVEAELSKIENSCRSFRQKEKQQTENAISHNRQQWTALLNEQQEEWTASLDYQQEAAISLIQSQQQEAVSLLRSQSKELVSLLKSQHQKSRWQHYWKPLLLSLFLIFVIGGGSLSLLQIYRRHLLPPIQILPGENGTLWLKCIATDQYNHCRVK